MLIRSYLADVYQLIQRESKKIAKENKGNDISRNQIDQAIFLEKEATLKYLRLKIKACARLRANHQNLEIFKKYLAKRWTLIQNVSLAYNQSPRLPINIICLALATKLAPIYLEHRFKLLMPTLDTRNQISLMDLEENDLDMQDNELPEDEKLALHQFILSDDKKHIIKVDDVFDSALYDGVLKHTSMLNPTGNLKELSESESYRVRRHSFQVSEMYRILQDIIKTRATSQTIGAAVGRLIVKLRKGGVTQGLKSNNINKGTEEKAGLAAIEGIVEFNKYLKLLTDDEREMLFALSSTANYTASTFELCWLNLRYGVSALGYLELTNEDMVEICERGIPDFGFGSGFESESDADSDPNSAPAPYEQGPYICAEQVASDFERMLSTSSLANLHPKNIVDSTEATVEKYETRYKQVLSTLRAEWKNPDFQITNPAEDQNEKNKFIRTIFRNQVKDASKLLLILNQLHYHARQFLKRVFLGNYLRLIASDLDAILILMKVRNTDLQLVILDTLGYDFVNEKLNTPLEFKSLLISVQDDWVFQFLDNIGMTKIASLFQNKRVVDDFLISLEMNLQDKIQAYLPIFPEIKRLPSMSSLFGYSLFTNATEKKPVKTIRGEETLDEEPQRKRLKNGN